MAIVIDERLCDGMSVPEIIENFNRILAMIDDISEGTEGKLLPDVTEADAGKVLTVGSDGKWAAAALPEAEG